MRTLLLIFVPMGELVRGGEPGIPTMREKLHAKIVESIPSAPVEPPAEQKVADTTAAPPVVMKQVVVAESKLIREVTAAIARKEQERRDEQFSPLQGGTIATIGGMKVGGWWTPEEGWTFLRLRKAQTPRSAEAAAAAMKELQELARQAR